MTRLQLFLSAGARVLFFTSVLPYINFDIFSISNICGDALIIFFFNF
jgi:hypothetical protein